MVQTVLLNPTITKDQWAENASTEAVMLSVAGLFLGAALGGVSFAILRSCVPQKFVRQVPSLFLYVAAILLLIYPKSFGPVTIAFACSGVGYSMAQVSMFSRIADATVASTRGKLTAMITFMIHGFGAVMAVAFLLFERTESLRMISGYRIFGFMVLMFAFFGHLFVLVIPSETPIEMVAQGKLEAARKMTVHMKSLWHEENVDQEMQEYRDTLEADMNLEPTFFTEGNMIPLLRALSIRVAAVVVLNYPFSVMKMRVADEFFAPAIVKNKETKEEEFFYYGTMVLVGVHFISATLSFVTPGTQKRRSFTSAINNGSFAFAMVLAVFHYTLDEVEGRMIGLVIAYEVFSLIVLPVMADVVIGEAFPRPKRVQSLAVVFAVEHLLQMVLVLASFNAVNTQPVMDLSWVTFTSAVGLIVICFPALWIIPQTSNKSALSARYMHSTFSFSVFSRR